MASSSSSSSQSSRPSNQSQQMIHTKKVRTNCNAVNPTHFGPLPPPPPLFKTSSILDKARALRGLFPETRKSQVPCAVGINGFHDLSFHVNSSRLVLDGLIPSTYKNLATTFFFSPFLFPFERGRLKAFEGGRGTFEGQKFGGAGISFAENLLQDVVGKLHHQGHDEGSYDAGAHGGRKWGGRG